MQKANHFTKKQENLVMGQFLMKKIDSPLEELTL